MRMRTNGTGVADSARDDAKGGGAPRRHTYAAIDLGTSNCRMLIARPSETGFRVVGAFSRIVRLGEGVERSGRLSEAAMERTIAALHGCARKMRRHGVSRARAVATEACRRAVNCEAFLARVAARTGIALSIIPSREEARLTLAGCLPLVEASARRVLIVDIGGGSTELVWLHCDRAHPAIAAWTSLPCGVVALAEAYGGDRLARSAYAAMVARVAALLGPFEQEHAIAREVAAGGVQMIGTSGTVTTLAAVFLDLARYDRARVDGLRLRFADVRAISARLLDLDYAGRAAIPAIGPERADLVVAGCAVLEAIQRASPVDGVCVADRGLRDGMLRAMMAADGYGVDPAAALAGVSPSVQVAPATATRAATEKGASKPP